jgi:hypothetical protein
MTRRTGSCPQCGGDVLTLDPEEDPVLFGIFGSQLAEHRPGCPDYPDTGLFEPAEL